MHVCVHRRRLYMGNLRKSERTSFATTPPMTWPHEIKCNICEDFTFNYNLQVL